MWYIIYFSNILYDIHIFTLNYTREVILFYDSLLTLEQEVQYFWKGRTHHNQKSRFCNINMIAVLYFLTRYISIIYNTINIVTRISQNDSNVSQYGEYILTHVPCINPL